MRHPHVHRHPRHSTHLINTDGPRPIPGPKPLPDSLKRQHIRRRYFQDGLTHERVPVEEGDVPAFVCEVDPCRVGREYGEGRYGACPFPCICRSPSRRGPDPEWLVHAYRRPTKGRVRRAPRCRTRRGPQAVPEHPDKGGSF